VKHESVLQFQFGSPARWFASPVEVGLAMGPGQVVREALEFESGSTADHVWISQQTLKGYYDRLPTEIFLSNFSL